MSLVQKLVKEATGVDMPSAVEAPEKTKKASLVERLATIASGDEDPGAPVEEEAVEIVEAAQKKASLVQRLASDFLSRPMGLPKLAEVRFENMEAAQKAVTKLYELAEKVLDDLETTGQDLQGGNLDLAAQKVLDMAHNVQGIKESFESDFPHLMKFTSPESEAPGMEGLPPPPPVMAPAPPAAPGVPGEQSQGREAPVPPVAPPQVAPQAPQVPAPASRKE